ncbi:hypothetical protein J7I98_20110 [Streptomyces sp. ISL-98]|uniref:hypothetical protein n=1 Tax=Streptomyces sp. ISL-98 TaxID=2819192 RepID=UPI001BEB78CC|nr:hypothetical protein [Streptomyces sp. ISL-98]MBT2508150.1 hypothetical protein [Streptomyces sp. ISL-98]
MPRPTAAQCAYGSATVIFSTLAMLLLSQTASGIGIAVIALAALALGVLVALTVPMPKTARTVRRTTRGSASPAPDRTAVSEAVSGARVPTHSRG